MQGKPWTEPDWAQAQSLLASGWTNIQVAAMFGRTAKQVQQKLHYQSLSASQRETMRRRINENRQRQRGARPLKSRSAYFRPPVAPIFEKAPEELFAERALRQTLEHRDITGAFFGDPLPGYSALDRRA